MVVLIDLMLEHLAPEGAEVTETVQVQWQPGHRLDDPRDLLRQTARQLVTARLVREQPRRTSLGEERSEFLEIDTEEFRDRGQQEVLQSPQPQSFPNNITIVRRQRDDHANCFGLACVCGILADDWARLIRVQVWTRRLRGELAQHTSRPASVSSRAANLAPDWSPACRPFCVAKRNMSGIRSLGSKAKAGR